MLAKKFLRNAGTLILLVAILGSFNLYEGRQIISMSPIMNALFFVLSAVLFSCQTVDPLPRRRIVLLFGWLSLLFALYLMIFDRGFASYFIDPFSGMLFLVLGIWALADGFCKDKYEMEKLLMEEPSSRL